MFFLAKDILHCSFSRGNAQRFALPACGRAWTMLGSRKKLEARKMPVNRADSHTSGARGVGQLFSNTPLFKRLSKTCHIFINRISIIPVKAVNYSYLPTITTSFYKHDIFIVCPNIFAFSKNNESSK